jgi:beta-glucosidase
MHLRAWTNRLLALAVTLLSISACGLTPMAPVALGTNEGTLGAKALPTGFLWGVSTAGYQWEGHDTTSEWALWDTSGKTAERNVSAANGYQLYDQDASLAQGLGCNTFRTSIEWDRIEPQKGHFDPVAIQHYHAMLNSLKAHGLKPVITLMHWSYPAWIDAEGGWENGAVAQDFASYAAFIAKEFGSQIDYYLTFNEPNAFLAAGYLNGSMPPGKHSPLAAVAAFNTMLKAHGLAYDAIHHADPRAKVSFNMYTAEYALPFTTAQSLEAQAAQKVSSDTAFMDGVTGKSQDGKNLGIWGTKLDFASFDYYCRLHVTLPFNLPRQDQWEVYPVGLYNALHRYYNRYHLPMFIAENGLATWNLQPRTDGWTRASYMVAHVQQVQRALAEGLPVIGYSQWSITDNYEWGSFSPRFGLYSVDCRNGDFTRRPTDGVDAYRAITQAGGVTGEIAARFGTLGLRALFGFQINR